MQEPNPAHTKYCKACDKWLPFGEFYAAKTNKDGMLSMCKKCFGEYKKKRITPEMDREYQLKSKFNITQKQYDRMLAKQNDVCASCKMPESRIHPNTGKPMCLHVDHDHKTGDVRALLCNKCNVALGYMDEDPERIRCLLAYAEWCQTREPEVKIIQFPLLIE